jgi:hypothetical protein
MRLYCSSCVGAVDQAAAALIFALGWMPKRLMGLIDLLAALLHLLSIPHFECS